MAFQAFAHRESLRRQRDGRPLFDDTHLPGYNFNGSTPNFRARMNLTYKGNVGDPAYHIPVNILDLIAFKHDLFYVSGNNETRRKADQIYNNDLQDIGNFLDQLNKDGLITKKNIENFKRPRQTAITSDLSNNLIWMMRKFQDLSSKGKAEIPEPVLKEQSRAYKSYLDYLKYIGDFQSDGNFKLRTGADDTREALDLWNDYIGNMNQYIETVKETQGDEALTMKPLDYVFDDDEDKIKLLIPESIDEPKAIPSPSGSPTPSPSPTKSGKAKTKIPGTDIDMSASKKSLIEGLTKGFFNAKHTGTYYKKTLMNFKSLLTKSVLEDITKEINKKIADSRFKLNPRPTSRESIPEVDLLINQIVNARPAVLLNSGVDIGALYPDKVVKEANNQRDKIRDKPQPTGRSQEETAQRSREIEEERRNVVQDAYIHYLSDKTTGRALDTFLKDHNRILRPEDIKDIIRLINGDVDNKDIEIPIPDKPWKAGPRAYKNLLKKGLENLRPVILLSRGHNIDTLYRPQIVKNANNKFQEITKGFTKTKEIMGRNQNLKHLLQSEEALNEEFNKRAKAVKKGKVIEKNKLAEEVIDFWNQAVPDQYKIEKSDAERSKNAFRSNKNKIKQIRQSAYFSDLAGRGFFTLDPAPDPRQQQQKEKEKQGDKPRNPVRVLSNQILIDRYHKRLKTHAYNAVKDTLEFRKGTRANKQTLVNEQLQKSRTDQKFRDDMRTFSNKLKKILKKTATAEERMQFLEEVDKNKFQQYPTDDFKPDPNLSVNDPDYFMDVDEIIKTEREDLPVLPAGVRAEPVPKPDVTELERKELKDLEDNQNRTSEEEERRIILSKKLASKRAKAGRFERLKRATGKTYESRRTGALLPHLRRPTEKNVLAEIAQTPEEQMKDLRNWEMFDMVENTDMGVGDVKHNELVADNVRHQSMVTAGQLEDVANAYNYPWSKSFYNPVPVVNPNSQEVKQEFKDREFKDDEEKQFLENIFKKGDGLFQPQLQTRAEQDLNKGNTDIIYVDVIQETNPYNKMTEMYNGGAMTYTAFRDNVNRFLVP